jgi:hypothetical protein
MIADKANDLINLARETLGADYLLPHFITVLNELVQDVSQIKTKISALEVIDVLIQESESLDASQTNYQQYAIMIKTLGLYIKQHSSQREIVEPLVKALISLRDKSKESTFKAISEELSHHQYTILR